MSVVALIVAIIALAIAVAAHVRGRVVNIGVQRVEVRKPETWLADMNDAPRRKRG